MSTKSQPLFFAGIDWGSQSHQVCVLDSEGTVLGERAFDHSGEGLRQMLDWMLRCAGCTVAELGGAIEIPHGPVVDRLLARGFPTFSINPKQLDRFRDRFSPAGAKDDRRDAHVLADALRTDPACLRELDPLDAEIVQLREWSRMSEELTNQRTRLTHQVRAQLWRYFPQFLKLGFPLFSPVFMALWALMPTPAHARRVRLSSVEKVLKKHRIRRLSAKQVLQHLRAQPLTVADGVLEAATAHIRLLMQQLTVIERQINEVQHTTETILASLDSSAVEESEQITPESKPSSS